MRRLSVSALVVAGVAATALAVTSEVSAESAEIEAPAQTLLWRVQGQNVYRGHYFTWQQSYDGRIWAWMSQDTYRAYVNGGLGQPANGPYTVTAGNTVYNGSYAGQAGPGGLVIVELRRRPPPTPQPPPPPPPPGRGGCPPGDTYWNVYVTADEGYNYQFKLVVRASGEAVYVMWSGDPMHWVQATGRVSGTQLSVTSTATVTDDRGQVVKVGGAITANLTPDCSEGTGRTDAGRVPGTPNANGNIRVVRYN